MHKGIKGNSQSVDESLLSKSKSSMEHQDKEQEDSEQHKTNKLESIQSKIDQKRAEEEQQTNHDELDLTSWWFNKHKFGQETCEKVRNGIQRNKIGR